MYFKNYSDYLQSQQWKDKALNRAEIDNYQCQMCGASGASNNPLECHHLSYTNIYHEDVDKDLVTLCRCCHRAVHRMMCRCTNHVTGQRGWKDTLPPAMRHVIDVDGTGGRIEVVDDKGNIHCEA